MTFDGRQPSMEEDLQWKKTFDGRQTLIEEDLQQKTAFDGRQLKNEDDINNVDKSKIELTLRTPGSLAFGCKTDNLLFIPYYPNSLPSH